MAVLKYYDTGTSSWQYIAASTTANFTTWKKTATGGETSVSGTDDNAVTLSYTVGLEQVFINGVLQVRGTDYVATTGTSITGLSALAANDVVTVICYAPFNVANTIAPTLVDAKGDLIAGTAADTVGRLAVGTNNQLLAVDSSTATGLKWTNPGSTLINTTSFTSVGSVVLPANTFTSTYKNYRIDLYISATTNTSAQIIYTRLRSGTSTDSTGNYDYSRGGYPYSGTIQNDSGQGGTSWFWNRSNGSGSFNGQGVSSVTLFRPQIADRTWFTGTTADGLYGGWIGGLHRSQTSYDSLEFGAAISGANITGTVNVYGLND